jgi:hypothetical protein
MTMDNRYPSYVWHSNIERPTYEQHTSNFNDVVGDQAPVEQD